MASTPNTVRLLALWPFCFWGNTCNALTSFVIHLIGSAVYHNCIARLFESAFSNICCCSITAIYSWQINPFGVIFCKAYSAVVVFVVKSAWQHISDSKHIKKYIWSIFLYHFCLHDSSVSRYSRQAPPRYHHCTLLKGDSSCSALWLLALTFSLLRFWDCWKRMTD